MPCLVEHGPWCSWEWCWNTCHWFMSWDKNFNRFCVCSIMSDSLPPMDCSQPGSSVHGVFQARILEWNVVSSGVAYYPRASPWCGDWTPISLVSCIGRQILYHYHHLGSPLIGFNIICFCMMSKLNFFWHRFDSALTMQKCNKQDN